MEDPFSAIKEALEPIFHLTPIRSGVFTYQEIQLLNETLEHYQPEKKETFINLVKALGAALHHFEKWQINFDVVKNAVDILAQNHKMPAVNWDKFLSHPKLSARFPFNASQDLDLFPWISTNSEKNFAALKSREQINLLITYSSDLGFSQRISTQLEKDPVFLSRYIMESKENFTKISSSRLIFYLTDNQIAHAIIKYLPSLTQEHSNPLMQVEQLVEKLNTKILSHGRSISTLLRNGEAKLILENSELFQIYQSDEYNQRDKQPASATEEGGLKQDM